MKLVPKAFALSTGILWGLVVFLVTNVSLLRGGRGELLSRLALIYPGYSFSFVGSLLGFFWGFVSMFIIGWLLAVLYNKFSGSSAMRS